MLDPGHVNNSDHSVCSIKGCAKDRECRTTQAFCKLHSNNLMFYNYTFIYIYIYISHSPIQRPEGSWRSTRGMRFPKSSILSSLLFQVLLHHQCPQAYRLPMNSNHWFWLAKAPIDETVQACQTSIGTCSTSCDATTSWCGWYFTARAQKLRGGCHRLVSLQDDMGNWKPLGYAHVSGMLIS